MKNYCVCNIAVTAMVFFQLCYAAVTPQKMQMAQKNVARGVWGIDWTRLSSYQRSELTKSIIDQAIEGIIQPQEKSQVAKNAITEKDQRTLNAINKIFEDEKTNLTPDYENAQDKASKLLTSMGDEGKKEALKAIDDHILNAINEKFEEVERPYFPHVHDYSYAKNNAVELQSLMQTADGKQKAQAAIDAYKKKHDIKD